MKLVLLTALGVGGATVCGALIGFAFKSISHKFSDIVLAFAAGVMLAAAILGLVLPSLEYGGDLGIVVTIAGIFTGAVCLNLIDRLVPHLHRLAGGEAEAHPGAANLDKVLLFGKSQANLMIISPQYEKIHRILLENETGVTLFPIETGYTGEKQKAILCVVSSRRLPRIKQLVEAVDPTAFVLVNSSTEVMGRGFTLPR